VDGYVYVGRWAYVESKEACVNRYYTSSISSPNCLGIPGSIRSRTTSHCSSRSRAGSTARIAHTSAEGREPPRGPINARGVSRSRTGTTRLSTWTTSDRTVATAKAGEAIERVSTKAIGRSGELWARVVEIECSNTEHTTRRGTSVAHTHSKSTYSTTKTVHAVVACQILRRQHHQYDDRGPGHPNRRIYRRVHLRTGRGARRVGVCRRSWSEGGPALAPPPVTPYAE